MAVFSALNFLKFNNYFKTNIKIKNNYAFIFLKFIIIFFLQIFKDERHDQLLFKNHHIYNLKIPN